LERESEVEDLREEMSTVKREHAHLINEQTRALRDAADQEDESNAHVNLLVREKAEADVEIKTSRDRIIVLKEEVERLRGHVHNLQQESADKEVKIVQMMKQHSLDKEDLQGLNIALDSKQQELQLVCFFSFFYIYLS
jgi:chromosome segregation ATPase